VTTSAGNHNPIFSPERAARKAPRTSWLEVRWTQVTSDQGLRRFGLLTTVSGLLDGRIDALDWATQALILAVQEPHAAPRGDVRTVFSQIP